MNRRELLASAASIGLMPYPAFSEEAVPSLAHGSYVTENMTGLQGLRKEASHMQVMPVPPRGYWRGDEPDEFSPVTPYVFSNVTANKGGVVPADGMRINGFLVPAGARVVQFRDFSAGDFYLTGAQHFVFRGCRFRGRRSAPGYLIAKPVLMDGSTFFNDMGGLGSASDQFNEVPIKVANARSMHVFRNRIQFCTTGIQANISGPIRIIENYITDLTTFGTDSHLNGITHNGGENNSWIMRNKIFVRTPDTSGRTVGQTDCVSFFQDFGDFSDDTAKKIDGNFLGGTGYCIYAGMNAGKPDDSVHGMAVTNNLITTGAWLNGWAYGPITAEPVWGSFDNVATNNRWADGPNAGHLAFGS